MKFESLNINQLPKNEESKSFNEIYNNSISLPNTETETFF